MQKRKVRSSNNDMTLPLTITDLSNHNNNASISKSAMSSSSSAKRSSQYPNNGSANIYSNRNTSSQGNSTLLTCFLFLLVILLVGFLLNTDFDLMSHPRPVVPESSIRIADDLSFDHKTKAAIGQDDALPLEKFQSLQFPLSKAKIVGLYFAASWCSMSTSATQTIDKIFSSKNSNIISTNRVLSNQDEDADTDQIKDFALVYISSDNSEEEMKDYMRWNWIGIPYDSPERNDIKRYYEVCAKVEMKELGMESRRFQIPTLLVLDSATHDIISINGVGDLEHYGEEVLDHWLEIQSLMRALEDKYEEP